jgi:hypothetical protein
VVTLIDDDLSSFGSRAGHRRDQAFMDVEREIRRLQALQAAMLSEVRASGSFLDDHHHSPQAWLRAVTNSTTATAQRQTRTALLLADMPLLAAAAEAGSVGADQIRLLGRLHANDRCRDLLAVFDEFFTEQATVQSISDFGLICRRWEAAADPDGAHRDHELSRENRHVKTSPVGAGHQFHAEGDALTGAIITEILDAHAQAEYETDLAARTELFGADAASHPLARTARQRRYDALVAICLKAAGTDESTAREPLVNIVCTAATLDQAIRDFIDDCNGTSTHDRTQPAVSERTRVV